MIAIVEAWRGGAFRRADLRKNILAGAVVGIVALPLAMAFAIASGAKPEQGLYTAIVAGLIVSAFGGSRVQIAGPTGAFIVILAAITAKYGVDGLQLATLMAGVILILFGVSRIGGVIKYIPAPVIVGFTAGIAVIIAVGELRDFFGLDVVAGGDHFHQKLLAILRAAPTAHVATAAFGMGSLALVLISPYMFKRLPGPLVALVAATACQALFQFEHVATIGSAFGGIPHTLPSLQFPAVSFARFLELLGPAFTIAMLGAIESLLSAMVADNMAGTRHDSNQELIGQGIANVVAPLFGGFAATGAIARTATNVRNGGSNPIAGFVHVLTLLLVIVLLAPFARDIPLATLAAILFVVAYNMSEQHRFRELLRNAPRNDVIVLLTTFALTLFSDLVIAVNVGVLLATILFMRRMAQAVRVGLLSADEVARCMPDGKAPANVAVYGIDGPLFFGATETFERALAQVPAGVHTVVLRMHGVSFVDATGLASLRETIQALQQRGVRVVACDANALVADKFARAGISALLAGDVRAPLARCIATPGDVAAPVR